MADFDSVYKGYDEFMKMFKLYKFEEIRDVLNLRGDEIVVDIGGGTGRLAENLVNNCKKIYVVDESINMLSKVPKNEKIVPILEDALNSSLKDQSADVVILSDVLHHIGEQEKLITQIHRVLNINGKILILDFEKTHIKTRILRRFESLLFRKLYFKTKQEVINMLDGKFLIKEVVDKEYYFIITGEKNVKYN